MERGRRGPQREADVEGAAGGAAAVDVALFRICFMGGWSIRSAAVHDYIDATCPASPAALRFFGWLTRR